MSVPNGSSRAWISAAVGKRGAVVGCTMRRPLTTAYASRSWTSMWDSGCPATVELPVRPAQQRKATCCAIVPVGKKAAASVPRMPAVRRSSSPMMPSSLP